MLVSEPIARARVALNDPNSTRWTDAALLEYAKDFQRMCFRIAPHTLLQNAGTFPAETALATTSVAMAVGDQWREAVEKYIVGMAFSLDSNDTANEKKGQWLIQQSIQMVTGQA